LNSCHCCDLCSSSHRLCLIISYLGKDFLDFLDTSFIDGVRVPLSAALQACMVYY